MPQVIKARYALRRGTQAQWAASNEVLAEGEAGLETDTGFRKVGDGSTPWNSLLYQLSGPAYDWQNLADGDVPVWDASNGRWSHAAAVGKTYQAGTGIEIANPNSAAPTISSNLGSIALSGRVDTYASLPTGLDTSDAGKAYLVEADGLIYIWDGSAWPAEGDGVAIGNATKAWRIHVTD